MARKRKCSLRLLLAQSLKLINQILLLFCLHPFTGFILYLHKIITYFGAFFISQLQLYSTGPLLAPFSSLCCVHPTRTPLCVFLSLQCLPAVSLEDSVLLGSQFRLLRPINLTSALPATLSWCLPQNPVCRAVDNKMNEYINQCHLSTLKKRPPPQTAYGCSEYTPAVLGVLLVLTEGCA